MIFLISRQCPETSRWGAPLGVHAKTTQDALQAMQSATGVSLDMLRVEGFVGKPPTIHEQLVEYAVAQYAAAGLEPQFIPSRLLVDGLAQDEDEAVFLTMRFYQHPSGRNV